MKEKKPMVSLQLYSRGDSKKYLDIVFNQIIAQDYSGARNMAVLLKNSLLKYYITRGVDCTNIHNTFHEFDFLLRIKNCSTKRDTCLDFIGKIRSMSQLTVSDPLEQLRLLYDDLRYAYLYISKGTADTILDCFDEIRGLQPRLQERGGSAFNYYTYTLKHMGDCEGLLVDVIALQGKIPAKETMAGLTSAFQKLFGSIQAVFAPPIMLDIKPEDVQRQLKRGKTLAEMAKASGHREEELQAMLSQIEAASAGDET